MNRFDKNALLRIGALLAYVAVITVTLLVVRNNVEASKWTDGVYFITEDVEYTDGTDNSTVTFYVVTVGKEYIKRLSDPECKISLISDSGKEEPFVWERGVDDKKFYSIMEYSIFVDKDKEYSGMEIVDADGNEYISPSFHLMVSSNPDQTAEGIYIERNIQRTEKGIEDYIAIVNETSDDIVIEPIKMSKLSEESLYLNSTAKTVSGGSSLNLGIQYKPEKHKGIIENYVIATEKGIIRTSSVRYYSYMFLEDEQVLDFINNYYENYQ